MEDSLEMTQYNGVNKSADLNLICPYCEVQFPSGVLSVHLDSCLKKSSTTQLDEYVGARPKKSGKAPKETERKYQSSQKKYDVSHLLPSSQNKAYCDQVEKHTPCPFCFQEIPVSIYRSHVHHCSEPMTSCQFCKKEFLSSDEAEHLKICDVLKSDEDFNQALILQEKYGSVSQALKQDFSYNEKLEEECTVCPFCTRKIPDDRYIKHLSYCSQQKTLCKFCQVEIFVADEKEHFEVCKVVKSEEDFKCVSRKNKKKLKKENSNSASSPDCNDRNSCCNSSYHPESLNNQKICKHSTSQNHKSKDHGCNSSGNDVEKKEKEAAEHQKEPHWMSRIFGFSASRERYQHKSEPKVSHSGNILLPCEFCDKQFPEHVLIEHESGCRPDLVSFPKPDIETDTPSRENSDRSAKEEINKALKSNDNHCHISRYNKNCTTKPGEFLNYYASHPGCVPDLLSHPTLEKETDAPSRQNSITSAKEEINNASKSNDNHCHIGRYNKNHTMKPGEFRNNCYSSENTGSDCVKQNDRSCDRHCKNSSKQVPIGSERKEAFIKEDFNGLSNIEATPYKSSEEKRMFTYDFKKKSDNDENSLVSGILSINQYSSASTSEAMDIYQPCVVETNCKSDVNAITQSLNNLHFSQSGVEENDSSSYSFFHSSSRHVNYRQYNNDEIISTSVNQVAVLEKRMNNRENAT